MASLQPIVEPGNGSKLRKGLFQEAWGLTPPPPVEPGNGPGCPGVADGHWLSRSKAPGGWVQRPVFGTRTSP